MEASTSTQPTEIEPSPGPSGVNVVDYVTIKLCRTNFFSWKEQMLRFLESQETQEAQRLSGFIHGTIKPPPFLESDVLEEERDGEQVSKRERKGKWVEGQKKEWEDEQEENESWETELEPKRREARSEFEFERKRREAKLERDLERELREMRKREWEEAKPIFDSWKSWDDLVREWIFATVTDEILEQVKDLKTARDVWIMLRSIVIPPFELSTDPTQVEPFPCPMGVDVADFVPIKLSPTNYIVWGHLMLTFLESKDLSGFVDGKISTPNKPRPRPPSLPTPPQTGETWFLEEERWEDEEKEELKRREDWEKMSVQEWGLEQERVKKWEQDRAEEWKREQKRRQQKQEYEWEREREQEREREWERKQEQELGHELARRENWKPQLEESQEEKERRQKFDHERERRNMWDREQERREKRKWKRRAEWERQKEEPMYRSWTKSDRLVRKWIQATLGEQIEPQVASLVTAREVWDKLKKMLTQPVHLLSRPEPIDWKDQKKGQIQSKYVKLHKAALTADWKTAETFLDEEPDAVFQPITLRLETALIVAVRSADRNRFVKKLMKRMGPENTKKMMEREKSKRKETIELMEWERMWETVPLLAQKDIFGATALHAAVEGGNIEAARRLVGENPDLANIPNRYGTLAVHVAAGLGNRDMVHFLLRNTMKLSENENQSGLKLLHYLASGGLFDVALKFLKNPANRHLASLEPSPLEVMAQKRTAFRSGTDLNILQRFVYSGIPLKTKDIPYNSPGRDRQNRTKCLGSALVCVRRNVNALFWYVTGRLVPACESIRETKLIHQQALDLVQFLCEEAATSDFSNATQIFTEPLNNATCMGIHEIVDKILGLFPSAIHLRSENDQTLFHLAVVYRRENVFNLIYQLGEDRRALLALPDVLTNNALHLVGKMESQQRLLLRASAAGAALQMQCELQWFKEVGNLILPQAKDHMNVDRKTPQELFTETHKNLVKEGEDWMKNTANSCSIVAALITTIVFAAILSIPGGWNGNNGLPVLLGDYVFAIFAVSDALALFFSSTSLLMFLSILTSRYAEQDFLYSLPRRMIIGLITLFLSILFMMFAFGATLRIISGKKQVWVYVSLFFLIGLPVTLFVLLQFPLLLDMIKSTYYPKLGKQINRILH